MKVHYQSFTYPKKITNLNQKCFTLFLMSTFMALSKSNISLIYKIN